MSFAKFNKLFTKVDRRYKIHSFELIRLRQNLKLSVQQFATIAGWSSAYQYKLESGIYNTISEKTVDEILQVFSRCGLNSV